MRKGFFYIISVIAILFLSTGLLSQNCGIKNPSFEYNSGCPNGFSAYDFVDDWVNILPDIKSEPDYFNESCPNGTFGSFNYTGYSDVDVTVQNFNTQHLCGRIGMYLNKDTGDDARLKEYITQRVDLTAGVTYQIKIQVEKSTHTGSSTLQRDLTFFGFNGTIPTTEINFCPVGIDSLAAVPHSSISTTNQTFIVTFTPSINYQYIVIGANCNSILYATATGYIFIDKVELRSTSNTSAFTAVIEHVSNDSNYAKPQTFGTTNRSECKNCFSDKRNKMFLVGNQSPTGVTSLWSQNASNPETVIFSSPADSSTSLVGNSFLTPGFYMFYYSFSNGVCTMIDSMEVEVKPALNVYAGPDVLNCGGNNDSYNIGSKSIKFQSTPISIDAAIRSNNDVVLAGATVTGGTGHIYWSMLRPDGSEHIFPHSRPFPLDSGFCQGRVLYTQNSTYSTGILQPFFSFKLPEDSVYFILNVIDECNTVTKDTILYVIKDVNLRADNPTYCVGDSATVYQIPNITSCYLGNTETVTPSSRKSFTWTLDDPALTASDLTISDSLNVFIGLSARPGWHTIRLTIYDSISNCSYYDEHDFFVKKSLTNFSAGKDYIFCGGSNDGFSDTSRPSSVASIRNERDLILAASPAIDTINANGFTTWWSMIRQNGTEWTFSNPCGIPYDGPDEGDVLAIYPSINPIDCAGINPFSIERNYSHSPTAAFQLRNPRDSIYFIFHLLDICGTDTIEYKDTMLVNLNDVDLITGASFCVTDTGFVSQYETFNFRKLLDTSVSYTWTGPAGINFINNTVSDSVRFTMAPSITRGIKKIRLTVVDSVTGCTWYDESEVKILSTLDSINAGPDIIICNSSFANQVINMNAFPSPSALTDQSYSTYWSVIEPTGTEYIYNNPCGYAATGTGTDDGLAFTASSTTNPMFCGNFPSLTYNPFSHSPYARFTFKTHGERRFVWHVIDKCDTSIHLTDTVDVKWDFNEPTVDAGPNQNPNCDAAILTGSPSASSSGNSGCFRWRQISGPGKLNLLNSNKRIAYLSKLDSAAPGVYLFEYSLGCGFCSKKDTISLTIATILPPPFNLTWDTISKICIGDNLIFTASGGIEYEWYINDSLVQNYSSDSVFTVANSLDSIKVSVRINDSINECVSFDEKLSHTYVGVVCYAFRDTLYSCGDICVSTIDLPYGNQVFQSCNSLTTNIGATFSLSDTCITYNNLTAPNTWLYDTLCVVLKDTVNNIYDTTDIFITNCDSTIFLSCQDTTLYLDNNGNIIFIDSAFVIDSLFASTGIDSITISKLDFDCTNTGNNLVTVSAYSHYYNKVATCISTVTILDTIKPVVICHDTTLYLGATGLLNFDTSATLTSISENCSIDSVWINTSAANCSDDTVTVTIFAQDVNGNIGECSSQIIILDTIAPLVSCHDTTLFLNGNGAVYFDTSAVLTSIIENCIVDSVWLSLDSATCMDDSVYTTIFARDESGNIGQCIATIIIFDTTPPAIICHDTTLYLGNNGLVTFDTSAIFTSVTENCSVDSIWIDQDSADCNQSSKTIEIFARDNSGNIGQCTSIITILDTIKPVVNCHDTILYLGTNGLVTFDTSAILTSITENCTIDSVWMDAYSASCIQDTLNITIFARDASGNIGECTSQVIALDTIAPIVLCHDTTLYLNGNGKVFFDTSAIVSSIVENCSLDSVWLDIDSASCMDATVTTTVFARDVSGNIGQCTSIITIRDTTKPIVFCQDTTLYINSNGLLFFDTSAVFTSVTENCSIDSIWINRNSSNCSQSSTTITVFARDNSGNIGECTSTIFILDTIKPIVNCHDTTLYSGLTGNISFDTSAVLTSIYENCVIDSVWTNINSINCLQDSVNVTIYVRDVSGNIGECTSRVFVLDTIAPVISCHDTTLFLTISGNVFFDTSAILNSITENCNVDSVWMDIDSATCIDAAVITTIFARDASGNIGQCTSIITILDTIKPVISCHDTTLFLNNNGVVYFDTSAIFTSVIENCTIDSIWINKDSADCSRGRINVDIFARDNSGNIGSCSAIIFVLDTIKPTAICKPSTIYLAPTGYVLIDSSYVDNGSYDNCGISTITISKDSFSCNDIGLQIVTLVVTDNSGNIDSCSAMITVIDTNAYFSFAGNDTSYCNVSSITMNGNLTSGIVIGTWRMDTSYSNASTVVFANANHHNTTVTNIIEGEYRFIWNIKTQPCFDYYDTILIRVFDQPNASLPKDMEFCYDNEATIVAQPVVGLARGTWTNYFNNSNMPGTTYYADSARITTILEGGEYRFSFEVTNGVCPSSADSITIIRHHVPVANFSIDTTELCNFECLQFNNLSYINPSESIASYSWKVDSYTTSARDFNLCFDEVGKKDVSLVVVSAFGCRDSVDRKNLITVHPKPIAGFQFTVDDNLSTYIRFFDNSVSASFYTYSFGDGNTSPLPEPNHNYADVGNYSVYQIVADTFGCADTAYKLIKIRNLSVYVPNSFTPNNDGINDVFIPVVLGDGSANYEFRVFNRWGEQVFFSNSKLDGWDGYHKGTMSQQDVYVWKLKVIREDGLDTKEYTGHVNLIR